MQVWIRGIDDTCHVAGLVILVRLTDNLRVNFIPRLPVLLSPVVLVYEDVLGILRLYDRLLVLGDNGLHGNIALYLKGDL